MAIRHKRTTTSGYTWQSSDLVEGQIGLNLTDGTAHIKKANGSIVAIGGIENVVEDTTPQLGGDLDVNGNKIVSTSNGNIAIEPNGTGIVTANKNIETTGDVKAKELHATNSSGDEGGQINLAQAATNSTLGGDTVTVDIWQNRFRIFGQGGDARGVYIDLTAAAAGVGTNLLSGGGGISDIVEDTTPQLGGDLDVNGHAIVSASNGDISITPNGTGSVIIDGNEFPQTQGAAGEVLTADGSGLVEWKLPQTISAQVYNADSVTINKGEPVYVFSSTGTNISVKRALNTGDATSAQTLGLANESITAGSTGIVICQGLLKGVDTSSYTAGQGLYLGSTAGSITTTKPYAPNHLVYLGFVETVNAVSGRIYVRTQNGYELDEIHDVNIDHNVALNVGDYLRRNDAGTLWENSPLKISDDGAPQLGGNLDVNGNSIVSVSNGNITIAPNGTGKVIISGDLQVDGTTTTINSTTLDVDDINITIAKGAANAAAADGGGITLEGPTTAATFTYASADNSWNLNKKVNVNTSSLTALSLTNGTDTIDFVPLDQQIAFSGAGYVNSPTSVNILSGTASIVVNGTTNSDMTLTTSGTGNINLDADTVRIGDSGSAATLTTNGAGNLVLNTNAGTNAGSITLAQGSNGNITIAPNGTGSTVIQGVAVGVITSTSGSSSIIGRHTATASSSTTNYSFNVQKHRTDILLADMTDEPAVVAFSVRDSGNNNRVFGRLIGRYSGTGTNPSFTLQHSVDGFTTTTNSLTVGAGTATWGATNSAYTHTTNGTGNLTLNTNSGTNSGSIVINQGANANIALTPNGTGKTAITNLNYNEAVYTAGSTTGTITPDCANGPVQSITLTGSITLNAFANPVSGQTLTLIVTQPSSGGPYTLTSTMKFAGGSKTLSTAANAIDIITVSYIGTTYYASLAKGFA